MLRKPETTSDRARLPRSAPLRRRSTRLAWLAFAVAVLGCECDPATDRELGGAPDDGAVLDDAGDRDATIADASRRDASSRDASRPDAGIGPVDSGVAPEPTLSVVEADVLAALHCPTDFVGTFDPVLLVHGTGANADVAWDDGYVPALTAEGFDVCTLDLPAWSWESIPLASEYVVVATRRLTADHGRPIAWVGHSQASLEFTWAMDFFPSLGASVSDVVFLAAVTHGAAQSETACGVGACRVAAWQMRPSSAFVAAIVARDETPSSAPYTSIYSTTDSTAVAPTSVVVGGTNIAIQSLCPGREVSHAGMLTDAVAYALVVDALTHDGGADPERFDASTCDVDYLGSLSGGDVWWQVARGGTTFASTYLGGPMPDAEPALPDYAR